MAIAYVFIRSFQHQYCCVHLYAISVRPPPLLYLMQLDVIHASLTGLLSPKLWGDHFQEGKIFTTWPAFWILLSKTSAVILHTWLHSIGGPACPATRWPFSELWGDYFPDFCRPEIAGTQKRVKSFFQFFMRFYKNNNLCITWEQPYTFKFIYHFMEWTLKVR